MKILQLCLRVPFPAADGGSLAMLNMAESLTFTGSTVTMLCINTDKHFTDVDQLPSHFVAKYHPQAVFADTSVKPIPAFLNLFRSGSYNVDRFDIPEFRIKLESMLESGSFDAILVESMFMAPYLDSIRKITNAPVFLRAHNVEHVIWERLATRCGNSLKRKYLEFLAMRLKQYESKVINKFDGLLAISELDAEWFRQIGSSIPVQIAPVSVDTTNYNSEISIKHPSVAFHLGSMDWMPNLEGVDWFLKDIFPLLNDIAELKIVLAGKGMPANIFSQSNPKLVVNGKVDDAKRFMSDKNIMLVPLLSGGGMRVKIIEGLAMGKTIISTTTGAEGVQYTNGLNMLIADEPGLFAEHVRRCFQDEAFCSAIGKQARQLAVSRYDNSVVGKQVAGFIQTTGKIIAN